ncbi:hypothetical protein [Granulicatella adiacens]|uniref:hypothetical protein n=1 Tax=Granulicatella adiacens TaxID=46124 RepID=UPI003C7583B5
MKFIEYNDLIKSFYDLTSLRSKRDVILLMLNTVKVFEYNNHKITNFTNCNIVQDEESIKILVFINKMQRIFFCTKNKIHSFCFPFSINFDEGKYNIFYKDFKIEIETVLILIDIFSSKITTTEDILSLLWQNERYNSKTKKYKSDVDSLLHYLLIFEDGYLRFDFNDTENYDVLKHPENHIDFFYTNANSFKLGIEFNSKLTKHIDIIDRDKKCFYISEPKN